MLAGARSALGPVSDQPQRVVPQRVDLDRLAAPRGHDPVLDAGIHPGERVTLLAACQQAVLRIHPDVVSGPAQVPGDDAPPRRPSGRAKYPSTPCTHESHEPAEPLPG